MSLRIERYYPLIAAGSAAVVAIWFASDIPPFSDALAAGTMTFGIVVAGFSATQRNMLLGMGGTRVMRIIVESGYHRDILDYTKHSVYAGLLVALISGVRFFVYGVALQDSWVWTLWLACWTGSVIFVLAQLWRNERLMFLLVKRFMEDDKTRHRRSSA